MAEPLLIEPIPGPLRAVVTLPGSKSMTNRALVCAALAEGTSHLHHALEADDTHAMVEGLQALGVTVEPHWAEAQLVVHGAAGGPMADAAIVDARLSGTTARFLLPVAALGEGLRRVDGAARMRERPMAAAVDALRLLGADLQDSGAPGHLPVDVVGGSLTGGELTMRGDVSSQFLSGLLLTAPAMPRGLTVHLDGPLVSRPYVAMTVQVMADFGVTVSQPDAVTWRVEPQTYQGREYEIEPDASAASYAFAVAALVGGHVTVDGLGDRAIQGDLAFVDLLEQMGAEVERGSTRTLVRGTGALRIEADLADISDTAQTLAVVAAFADSPTRVTGIGFIRGKETNRIHAVVTELRRLGIEAEEEPDGFVVRPAPIQSATVQTYDDHRMAMAFGLLIGVRVPGIRIADPDCVGKTFPGYWKLLEELGGSGTGTMVLLS